ASGIRNQLGSILRNPKRSRGFSEAEKAALRSVVDGNMITRGIQYAGGGIGNTLSTVAGAMFGGPAGAVAGNIASQAGREVAGSLTERAAERARAAIASGMLRDPDLMQ